MDHCFQGFQVSILEGFKKHGLLLNFAFEERHVPLDRMVEKMLFLVKLTDAKIEIKVLRNFIYAYAR